MTRSDIVALAEHSGWPAVSIYLPTAKSGTDVQQGPIRLKNHLVEAERQLSSAGMRPTIARDLLADAARLVGDLEFWNDRLDGVAIFIAPDQFWAYHLAFAVPDHLSVGATFHLRPLVPALHATPAFYALALEKNRVRLIHCGRRTVEVDVPNMPRSYQAFLSLDYSEKQMQAHTAGRVGSGSVIRHGAGDKGAEETDRLRRFCVAIEHAVSKVLGAKREPLALIATKEIAETYRHASTYPLLAESDVLRSPKLLDSPSEVRAAVEPLIRHAIDEERDSALNEFRAKLGTGLASSQMEEIVRASGAGRVDALIMSPDASCWGSVDPESGTVKLHADAESEDLLNLAMRDVLRNHGAIYQSATDPEVGAIFRY